MAITVTTTTVSVILSKQATSGGTITGSIGDFVPLVDRLIRNKWQLYNRSRQKVSSDVRSLIPLKPLQMFTDSKQSNKPFVLGGFQYKPMSDTYTVELFEYDNTTDVTLIR